MPELTLDSEGENVEEIEHLPTQQKYRDEYYHHGYQLTEGQTAARGFVAAGGETKNIQGGKTEDYGPEDVVDILPRPTIEQSCNAQRGHVSAGNGVDR